MKQEKEESQPRTQSCSRYPSDQRRLGTERDRRIFPNLVPRALFPGFGGGAGKGPGIGRSHDHQTPSICGCNKLALKLAYDRIR